MNQRVQKVSDLIRRNLRQELSLSEMARSVNLSPSRLRHLFKAETGVSPAQYLRSLRMQQAEELLKTTFLSIKEIRERVGISDRSRFMREFKKVYGIPPVQYRARMAQGMSSTGVVTDLSGLLVLVVEDDLDTQEIITLLLEHFGARVIAVESAIAALAALERMRPDVLVADIGIPGEDGYALIRKVRAMGPERGGEIPAVALTAYASLEDRERAFSAGFQIHVPKPAEPDKLAAAVASLARRTKAERAAGAL